MTRPSAPPGSLLFSRHTKQHTARLRHQRRFNLITYTTAAAAATTTTTTTTTTIVVVVFVVYRLYSKIIYSLITHSLLLEKYRKNKPIFLV